MRADVLAKKEPTYTAYVLANTSTTFAYGGMPPVKMASLDYIPHPQVMYGNGTGITPNREDSLASYTHALLWAITLDDRHAQKAIEIMDGWAAIKQPPIALLNGLQVAWAAAVWPRAAEIIRHSWSPHATKPWAGAAAWGNWMHEVFLPMLDEGASTNGNIGLVMTEAALAIAIYNENTAVFDTSIERWRAQAPAYLYVKSDGPFPKRPPQQRYLQGTSPTCEPNCTDKQMINYWHGQSTFDRDGICQETCRDLGHVSLGFATLVNTAETAYHQGIDLYAEDQSRLIAGAELHASLLAQEPSPLHQPVPPTLCGGRLKGATNGSTWFMLHNHMVGRKGLAMPNVSAILPFVKKFCWDQSCWEALTHGNSN